MPISAGIRLRGRAISLRVDMNLRGGLPWWLLLLMVLLLAAIVVLPILMGLSQ